MAHFRKGEFKTLKNALESPNLAKMAVFFPIGKQTANRNQPNY